VGVAVDVLVTVDIVSWYDGGARDSASIPCASRSRVLDLDLGLDWFCELESSSSDVDVELE
jgi:hypothetical protein